MYLQSVSWAYDLADWSRVGHQVPTGATMVTMMPRRTATVVRKKPAAAALPRKSTGRVYALDVPFHMRAVASVNGARWDADHGVYLVDGEHLPAALAPFAAQPYSWESRIERELNADSGDSHPGHGTQSDAIVPREHQRVAIDAITSAVRAKRAGFLLADDVGLGKTITAWESIRRMPSVKTVLIVCPLAVIAHWRRTVLAMGDMGRDIVIINYERLGKLFEIDASARKKIRSKKGLAKAGTALEFDVIVWDESHRCKNPTAARSKLAAKLNASAGFILWLSATAGQNPLELSYLAPLLSSVTGTRASDLKAFEEWCAGQKLGVTRGAFGRWDWRGDPADCEKVRALLFDGAPAAGIRRRPEDIVGWPEINRILTPIELDSEGRALYQEAWVKFRRELELIPKGKDPKSALAATLRLRQKSSLLRVSGTAELVKELVENQQQVAVSIAFLETLEQLKNSLSSDGIDCAVMHGSMLAAQKEIERMRFQRGEVKVILFTMEEGISLHQGEHNDVPRSEVIHDLRWSAIQMAQIEGRCHRDGRFAQVYWAYADGTIEEKIASIVCRRIQAMKGMVGDDVETLREIERLLSSEAVGCNLSLSSVPLQVWCA